MVETDGRLEHGESHILGNKIKYSSVQTYTLITVWDSCASSQSKTFHIFSETKCAIIQDSLLA